MKFIPISRYTIQGQSMYPTLHHNSDVLSFNWFYKPNVGDLVVVRYGDKEIIKRVSKVFDREILIEGDNKNSSTDSRHFGPVGMDKIVGKVVYASNEIPCPQCGSMVIGIYGRKDAICKNCGFKLTCCGEP